MEKNIAIKIIIRFFKEKGMYHFLEQCVDMEKFIKIMNSTSTIAQLTNSINFNKLNEVDRDVFTNFIFGNELIELNRLLMLYLKTYIIAYLKYNDIYTKFAENLMKHRNDCFIDKKIPKNKTKHDITIERYINIMLTNGSTPFKFINGAFTWSLTSENYDFWSEHDYKIRKFLLFALNNE